VVAAAPAAVATLAAFVRGPSPAEASARHTAAVAGIGLVVVLLTLGPLGRLAARRRSASTVLL